MTNIQHSMNPARDAAHAIAQWRFADLTGAPTEPHADRLRAIGVGAQFRPCTDGAVALLLCGLLGGLFDELPVDPDLEVEAIHDTKDRILASLRAFIEHTTGVSGAALGFEGYYFPSAAVEAVSDQVAA
jgi:hypothetical protein